MRTESSYTTETTDPPPSMAELMRELREETSTLFREEVALAKQEMSEKVSRATRNAIMLTAGALTAFAALIILLVGISALVAQAFLAMDLGLGTAAFLGLAIVALIVGIIAGALIGKALDELKDESFVPKRTIETLKGTKQWATNQIH